MQNSNNKEAGEMMNLQETKKMLQDFLEHHQYEILDESPSENALIAQTKGGLPIKFVLRKSVGSEFRTGTLPDGTEYQLREEDPNYEGFFVQPVYLDPNNKKERGSSQEIRFPEGQEEILRIITPIKED